MAKVKTTRTERVKRWKEVILANLLSQYKDGMTEDDISKLYTTAELQDIKDAIKELITEGRAELVV